MAVCPVLSYRIVPISWLLPVEDIAILNYSDLLFYAILLIIFQFIEAWP